MKNKFKRKFDRGRIVRKFNIPSKGSNYFITKWGWSFRVLYNENGLIVITHPNSIHRHGYNAKTGQLTIEFKQFMDENTDIEDIFSNPLLRGRMNELDKSFCKSLIKNDRLIKPNYL